MFYDLENPIKFAKDICEILDKNGIWILEQSYLPMMLETVSYDTVCHEHIEFYALKQIDYIARESGLRIIDVETNNINGGSFQIVVAKKDSEFSINDSVNQMLESEEIEGYNDIDVYLEFKERIEKNKKLVEDFFKKVKEENKLVIGYGASTKGNVMLQYCNLTGDDLVAIADVNPDKYGHVTPGSRIPIISEEEARSLKPDYFFVLPWHFRDFILSKEKQYIYDSDCKFCFAFPDFEIVGKDNIE